jgi:hypothetical protein
MNDDMILHGEDGWYLNLSEWEVTPDDFADLPDLWIVHHAGERGHGYHWYLI